MLVEALAATPGTALNKALGGDGWTLDQHLLALVHDQLAVANWQRQGKKGAKRPRPISPLARQSARRKPAVDTAGRTQQDIDGLLAAMRTGAYSGG